MFGELFLHLKILFLPSDLNSPKKMGLIALKAIIIHNKVVEKMIGTYSGDYTRDFYGRVDVRND